MPAIEFTDPELTAVELALFEMLAMLNDHINASPPDDPENERRRHLMIRVQQAIFKIRYTH